jgi:hypothetical protein
LIAKHMGRFDIKVISTVTGANIDRRLGTEFPAKNKSLWLSAGYDSPPSFDQMLSELIAAAVTSS